MKSKKFCIKFRYHIILTILLSILTTLFVLWNPNGDILAVFISSIRIRPVLFVLNWFPVLLSSFFFLFIFKNTGFSSAINTLLWTSLAVINRIKIEIRDDPLYPGDFSLIKEITHSIGEFQISIPWGNLIFLFLITIILLSLGFLVSCRPFHSKEIIKRLLGVVLTAGLSVFILFSVYSSDNLYHSFPATFDHISAVYQELGFPYCFCYNFNSYQIDKPDEYNQAEAEAYENQGVPSEAKAPNINIIFVMNESFSDISNNPVFSFAKNDDPLQHYKEITAEMNCLSGHLFVPGFAGGTANTEFDVFTGIQTTCISTAATSAFRTVHHNKESVLSILKQSGYTTYFNHPGYSWYYNRQNVYSWFGADNTAFIEDMTDAETKGMWVTDSYLNKRIIQDYESAIQNGETVCSVNVTIQNHMTYTAEKYGDIQIPAVKINRPVSAETQTMADVYFYGIRDADCSIGSLIDYFRQRPEPVMVVFWGDHLPYFGENQSGYEELGIKMETDRSIASNLNRFKVPYFIWCNNNGAEAIDFQNAVRNLNLSGGNNISANYLGSMVLEMCGRKNESNWFGFLSDARKIMPVYRNGAGLTSEGTYFTVTPDYMKETEKEFLFRSYYRLTN